MRRLIIAGNWKMNETIEESVSLAKSIKESDKVDVIIAPTFLSLDRVHNEIKDKNIKLSAQDVFFQEEGAFTGEISPTMLKDVGCTHIIVGHSERRNMFCETDSSVNKKIHALLDDNLIAIMCIGETMEERDSNRTNEVLKRQLTIGLKDVAQLSQIIIAYEPVWAISSGDPKHKAATTKDVEQAHKFIRDKIRELYGDEAAQNIQILYGGSMKPENAEALLAIEDVDGGLIGGASLKAESFNKIIEIAERCN